MAELLRQVHAGRDEFLTSIAAIPLKAIGGEILALGPADATERIETDLPKIAVLTQTPVCLAALDQRIEVKCPLATVALQDTQTMPRQRSNLFGARQSRFNPSTARRSPGPVAAGQEPESVGCRTMPPGLLWFLNTNVAFALYRTIRPPERIIIGLECLVRFF